MGTYKFKYSGANIEDILNKSLYLVPDDNIPSYMTQDLNTSGRCVRLVSNPGSYGLEIYESGVWIPINSGLIETTYADLVSLKNNSNLIQGMQYRITDYNTVVNLTDVSSAGHQFDIIVTAEGPSTLSENAKAIRHAGDSYFASSNLDAWELKYTTNNNAANWGSSSGKGVIYYMKDERGNECPYDFKNIQFKIDGVLGTYYTFTYGSNKADASLNTNCFNNVIEGRRAANTYSWQFNFNAIYTSDSSFSFFNNRFSKNSYNNALMNGCSNNYIGEGVNGVRLGTNCSDNIIERGSNVIRLGQYSSYNHVGCGCSNIILGQNTSYCTFENGCKYIYLTSTYYCQYIKVDEGVAYIQLLSDDTTATQANQLQNVHIHLGVYGSSSSNLLVLTVPDRNLAYEYNFVKSNTVYHNLD